MEKEPISTKSFYRLLGASAITVGDNNEHNRPDRYQNGTIFVDRIYELLNSENDEDIETVVNSMNLISSRTIWKWCTDDEGKLRSDNVRIYCELLKSVISKCVEGIRQSLNVSNSTSKLSRRCHAIVTKSWFHRLFQASLWNIVPRSYFVSDILLLLCDDSLFCESTSGVECDCRYRDAASKSLSKLCLLKIMDGSKFTRNDISTFQEAFKFFLKRNDIYMLFPLSFFVSFNKMNRVFRLLLICHTFSARVSVPSDKEKLDVLTYMRFCRNFTINNPTKMLSGILSVTYDVTTNLYDDNTTSWYPKIARFLFEQFGLCCVSDMFDDYPELYAYVERYFSYYTTNILS